MPMREIWRRAMPAAALALAAAAPASSQIAPPDRGRIVATIDSLADAFAAQDAVPGMILAVVKGDDVLVNAGYGMADVEHGVRTHAESVFKIGSVTKQYAAAAVLRLVDQGRLSLDDDIREFFPDYPTEGKRITVRMLLNHTAGLKNYTAIEGFYPEHSRHDLTDEQLVDIFDDFPLDFEPGTKWSYSNSGYYLAGMIVQQLSGKSFAEFLEDELLEPLGLEQTWYCEDYGLIPHRVSGYEVTEHGLENTSYVSMNIPGAAGAMCATAMDMVRWTKALHAGKVVSPASLRLMTTAEGAASDISALGPEAVEYGNRGYGLGLAMHDFQGHLEVHHGGGINGFLTELAHYPADDLTIAVSVNASGPPPIGLVRQIAATVLGIRPAT